MLTITVRLRSYTESGLFLTLIFYLRGEYTKIIKAKKILMEEGRMVYKVEPAREIAKAFGLKMDKKLIRDGSFGYREGGTENVPRVSIDELSEWICTTLGKKPNEKTLKTANMMHGEGSHRDLYSEACATNL